MLYWNQLFTRVFPEEDVEMKHRTVNDYFKQQWPRLILFAAFTLGVSFFAPLKNFQLKWLIDSRSKQEALGYMGLVFAITFSSWFFERLSRRSFTKIACGAVEQVRQRIGIARLALRSYDLIIADEITASLDPDTSQQVMENLIAMPCMVVAITHDVSGAFMKRFDKVYRVTYGCVMETQ